MVSPPTLVATASSSHRRQAVETHAPPPFKTIHHLAMDGYDWELGGYLRSIVGTDPCG